MDAVFRNPLAALPNEKRVTHPGTGRYPDATFDYLTNCANFHEMKNSVSGRIDPGEHAESHAKARRGGGVESEHAGSHAEAPRRGGLRCHGLTTRNLQRKGRTHEEALVLVDDLAGWVVVVNTLSLLREALEVKGNTSISFWDAMIVAAAKQSDAGTLLSEDLSHGQEYGGVRVLNPFRQPQE